MHEYSTCLEKVGSELMLAVNLDTRGTLGALDLLEYSNIRSGTELSDRRARHGRVEPFGIKMWCLVDKIDGMDNWPQAPRLLEDVYSVADAVVFGNLLISLLRHTDRVTSASPAQLVNVIAPIMTEPGGPAWRQTTFFPSPRPQDWPRELHWIRLEADTYSTDAYGSVPVIATFDTETTTTTVFLVHRSRTGEAAVTIDLTALDSIIVVDAQTLSDADVYAKNTLDDPGRVGLHPNKSAVVRNDILKMTLPPVSWTALNLG